MKGVHRGTGFARYCNAFFRAGASFAVLALAALPATAGPNALLLWDDDEDAVTTHPPVAAELNTNTQALITALEAAGVNVTLSDHTQALYDGESPAPEPFDTVIHLNGNTTSTIDHLATSTVAELVNYVQLNGGAIITSENTEAQIEIPSVGLSALMEELMVLDRQPGAPPAFGTITLSTAPGQEAHPLLTGLTPPFSFTGGRMVSALRSYATDPATVILTDEAGLDAAAVRDLGAGRVISFHHAGNFHAVGLLSPTLSNPEVQQLYINAVLWGDQKFPTPVSITKEKTGSADASGAPFLVQFSEGVDGFDQSDLQIVPAGGIGFNPTPIIEALSDRLFRVTIVGLAGTGTLGLNLLDNDSITDQSFAAHPLGGAGIGNGALTGPVYTADAIFPNIDTFTPDPLIVPLGDRSTFTITFSEAMDHAFPPVIDVLTRDGGIIHASSATPPPSNRVTNGLLALYSFDEGSGDTVLDRSGVGTPIDLTIAAEANTSWQDGALSIDSPTILLSASTATKIIDACKTSGEVTIEAWVRPENNTQAGPARIVSISGGLNARDVTLEQDATAYEGRVRTTTTGTNGLPEITASNTVNAAAIQHLVYTRDAAGNTKLYVDDINVASGTTTGTLSGWSNFRLAIGNELSQNRAWLGELHLVAIYERALTPTEIDQNFDEGPAPIRVGDGQWLSPDTYEVSMDRVSEEADQGSATVRIAGAQDLAGNLLATDTTNTIGIISGSLEVEKGPSPSYLREAGTPFEFFVQISGAIGGLDYQWYKEDAAKVFQPIGTNAPALAFASLDLTDGGVYYCVITDTQSQTQTAPSRLEVVAELPLGHAALLGTIAVLLTFATATLRRHRAPNESPNP